MALALVLFAASPRIIHKWSVGLTIFVKRFLAEAAWVLLDQQFATGRAFGASGTPSAVLVDAEGKVASEVVVGTPAVLELAGAEQTQA